MFIVHPVSSEFSMGDLVTDKASVNLFSNPDGYVRCSDSHLPEWSLYPGVSEVNVGPSREEGFILSIAYRPDKKARRGCERAEELCGGDLIQLSLSEEPEYFIGPSLQRTVSTSLSTYLIIEHEAGYPPIDGSPIEARKSKLQLTNFLTGERAQLPGGGASFFLILRPRLKEEESCVRNGSHVKLVAGERVVGIGPDRELTLKPLLQSTFRDVWLLRRITPEEQDSGTRLLGFKMILNNLIKQPRDLAPDQTTSFVSAVGEMLQLLDRAPGAAASMAEIGLTGQLLDYLNSTLLAPQGIRCSDAVCRLLNRLTTATFPTSSDLTEKLVSLLPKLLSGKLVFNTDYVSGEVTSPLRSLIAESLPLLSKIPESTISSFLLRLETTSDPLERREVTKILASLCRTKARTVPPNQALIASSLFKDSKLSPALLSHEFRKDTAEVLFGGMALKKYRRSKESCPDLISQLTLYESILFGRHINPNLIETVTDKLKMFTLSECLKVVSAEGIDVSIRTWYIRILIAAHIDTGHRETNLIPSMLTFQYEGRVKKHLAEGEVNLLKTLNKFLTDTGKTYSSVCDRESGRTNELHYELIRLLEYMFRAGYFEEDDQVGKILPSLIGFLDGKSDRYTTESTKSTKLANEDPFRSVFRFRDLPFNQPIFAIKRRALKALSYAYERFLFEFWNKVTTSLYAAVRKLYFDQVEEGLLEDLLEFFHLDTLFLSNLDMMVRCVLEEKSEDLEELYGSTLDTLLTPSNYLFAMRERLVGVLMDTMRYEDTSLSEGALRLMVLMRSPKNRLLQLLPKSSITLSLKEKEIRSAMVDEVTKLRKVSRNDVIGEAGVVSVLESLKKLEEWLVVEGGLSIPRQRLLFALKTLPILVSLLESEGSGDLVEVRSRSFRLVRFIITCLPAAQQQILPHFTSLLKVPSEGCTEVELARVLALNEIFTSNTNLCMELELDDTIFKGIFAKLLSLVTDISSDGEGSMTALVAHRYLSTLENILDLEESNQVLYDLQATVLRFVRDSWDELNGSLLKDNKRSSLGLLECKSDQALRDKKALLAGSECWKGVYFVRTLSLMSCCALGADRASITCCRELVPYDNLVRLMDCSSGNLLYFDSLSKFFLNVYMSSLSQDRIRSSEEEQLKVMKAGIRFLETGLSFADKLNSDFLAENSPDFPDRLAALKDLNIKLKLDAEGLSPQSEFLHLADYFFKDFLHLAIRLFKKRTTLEHCDATSTEMLSFLLREVLRKTSHHLNLEKFQLLTTAIEKVNSVRSHSDETLLEVDDISGQMWEIRGSGKKHQVILTDSEGNTLSSGVGKVSGAEVGEETERINAMFQAVVTAIIKMTKKPVPKLFFDQSEELVNLGYSILGTKELQCSEAEFEYCSVADISSLPYTVLRASTKVVKVVVDPLLPSSDSQQLSYTHAELYALLTCVFEWLKTDVTDAFIISQILNAITLQLDILREKLTKAQLDDYVAGLASTGIVESLCVLMGRSYSAQPALTCLSVLLNYQEVQNRVLRTLQESPQEAFGWVITHLQMALAGYRQVRKAEEVHREVRELSVQIASPGMRLSVQLLGLLANKTTSAQDFLRDRETNPDKEDFLGWLLALLRNIPFMRLRIEEERLDEHRAMIIDILESVVLMTSTNTPAITSAVDNGVIESVSQILNSTRKSPLYTCSKNCTRRSGRRKGCKHGQEKLRTRIACYEVISTLLECNGHSEEVIEKLVEGLEHDVDGIFEDQTEHYQLYQDHTCPYQSTAQAALIKGYSLLRKVSLLDGFSSRDQVQFKFDDEIKDMVDYVEVMWNGSLEPLFFPRQPEAVIRRKVKDELLWGLKRSSRTDKRKDLLLWGGAVVRDMNNLNVLTRCAGVKEVVKYDWVWDWFVLILAAVIQVWLLLDLKDYEGRNVEVCGEGNLSGLYFIGSSPGGVEGTEQICVTTIYEMAHKVLGALQLISVILLILSYLLTNSHRFQLKLFDWRFYLRGCKSEYSRKVGRNPSVGSNAEELKRMKINIVNWYHGWLLVMLVASGFGVVYWGFFFCIHLMHITSMFDILTRVLKGATANLRQLLVIIPFSLFIIYIYSIIYFYFTRSMFDNSKGEWCGSLYECFTTAVRYSLRNSNGGHNYSWTNKQTLSDVRMRILIDATFWVFYSIIGLKVVTAIILDGFISMKKERESALLDMTTVCTICGLTKDQLNNKGIDWTEHTDNEHNIWSYIRLFYYLEHLEKKHRKNLKRNISAIKFDVWRKYREKKVSFFPDGESILWNQAKRNMERISNF